MTDLTGHYTREGKVDRAIIDAYSRRIVGWSIGSSPTALLATSALGMAIQRRAPVVGATLIHSDQGTRFTSWAFTERAKQSAWFVDGIDRRLLRQRRHGIVLIAAPGRVAYHAPLAARPPR